MASIFLFGSRVVRVQTVCLQREDCLAIAQKTLVDKIFGSFFLAVKGLVQTTVSWLLVMAACLILCILETCELWCLLHTVRTHMKCSIIGHFIRVDTVCQDKNVCQRKKYKIIWKT